MSINRVIISGNLTRDIDVRSTPSGMEVGKFGVAVNDRRRNQQTGEWEDYPNYVDCTIFGNRAEALAPYLLKGSKVAIEGKLRYRQWENDGQKRSKLEIAVDEVELMSGGQRQQAAQPQQQPSRQQQGYSYGAPQAPYQYPQHAPQQPTIYDEDVPF